MLTKLGDVLVSAVAPGLLVATFHSFTMASDGQVISTTSKRSKTMKEPKTAFDGRVEEMDADNLPDSEVRAAAITYERLRTALVIAQSVLNTPNNSDVLAVFSHLCAAASALSTDG
jgi:hypothetical protein